MRASCLVGLAVACAESVVERDSLRACLGFLSALFNLADRTSATNPPSSALTGGRGVAFGGPPLSSAMAGAFERAVLHVAAQQVRNNIVGEKHRLKLQVHFN